MKALRAFIRGRYPAALVAGLMLAASFPSISIAGFAWIAPGLILFVAVGLPAGRAFCIGYVAGLAHYLASLYWLLLIPVPWNWAWTKALGWMALSAYMSLYPATWVWLCWKMFPVKWEEPFSLKQCAERFFSVSWVRRLLWGLSAAALWVALEMMISRFLGGFPWNLLGESQYRILPLIQIASVTGIYGVAFLAVWFSISLMSALATLAVRRSGRTMLFAEIIVPMLVVAVVFAAGYEKLLRPQPEQRELTIALIQPSIPQSVIWDESESEYRFQQLIKLSQQALTNKPDLLIWPEAAVPKMVGWDKDIREAISGLARSNKVWMIIGSDDFVPYPKAKSFKDGEFFNSSFLVSPEGKLAATYKKRNLVIFGEYVPLVKWLPFLKYLTPVGESGFSSGDRAVSFDMRLNDGPSRVLTAKTSVLICYEDVFPQLAREYVQDDTDFLVNITNDGWFGEGAEQWQHAAAGVFRAVETGTPLVRCCNNGLTCWIDAEGCVRQIFTSESHGIYGPGFMIAHIPLLAEGEKSVRTFYRLHGDWFGWGCVGWTILAITAATLRRKGAYDK